MHNIPLIQIQLACSFSEEYITLILKRLHNVNCFFFHLSEKEKSPEIRNKISLETAAEYLSNPLNREPNILGILVNIKTYYFVLTIYSNDSLASALCLGISPLEATTDISPWVLSLLNIVQGAPIESISTINKGSSSYWEYGRIAESKRLREEETNKSS
ncbi:MAG: hypothetical protein AB7F19_01650 [Candidatus Babeliales bacterium]